MSTEAPPAPAAAAPSPTPLPTPTNAPNPTQSPSSGVSEPWAKSWIQPDFSLNHTALDRLPDHLKGMRPTLEKYKAFEDVLVGFQNQGFMSAKKAIGPLPPDSPESVIKERKIIMDRANGVPDTPKEYGLTKPADLPDNVWDQKLADSFTSWAHENSISPAATKKMLALQVEHVKGQLAQQAQYEGQFWTQQQETFDATIRQANIAADRASALVEKGAIALGLDLSNEQTKTFMKGADARLMAMRHAIAIGEDRAVTSDSTSSVDVDPAELARSARSDPSNPLYAAYWNKKGELPRAVHDAAVEKVNGWLKLAEDRKAKAAGGRR